jgi:hypothetical protein
MKFILEFKTHFKEDDIVLIHYWYNGMITPVKVLEKKGRKYLVSHNVNQSKIQNAPDELIKNTDIISKFRN